MQPNAAQDIQDFLPSPLLLNLLPVENLSESGKAMSRLLEALAGGSLTDAAARKALSILPFSWVARPTVTVRSGLSQGWLYRAGLKRL